MAENPRVEWDEAVPVCGRLLARDEIKACLAINGARLEGLSNRLVFHQTFPIADHAVFLSNLVPTVSRNDVDNLRLDLNINNTREVVVQGLRLWQQRTGAAATSGRMVRSLLLVDFFASAEHLIWAAWELIRDEPATEIPPAFANEVNTVADSVIQRIRAMQEETVEVPGPEPPRPERGPIVPEAAAPLDGHVGFKEQPENWQGENPGQNQDHENLNGLDPEAERARVRRLSEDLLHACEIGNLAVARDCLEQDARPRRHRENDGQTALHLAANNKFLTDLLLEYDVDLFARDAKGRTPLMAALRHKNASVVRRLLRRCQTRNLLLQMADDEGNTCLHIACEKGDVISLRKIIETDLDINFRNEQGRSPLHNACIRGHREVVKILLNKGAETVLLDETGCSSLHYAAKHQDMTVLQSLLDRTRLKEDINRQNAEGKTPLFYASEEGNLGGVVKLLRHGADPNTADQNGWTSLHAACASANTKRSILVELLAEGADANARTKDGTTPLYLACWSGMNDLVNVLLENGADVNITNEGGLAPVHVAALKGDDIILENLLFFGANPNARNVNGLTPLYLATLKDERQVIKTLLDGGADPKYRRYDLMWTPLHLAGRFGNLQIAKMLIEHDRSILNHQDHNDEAPIHLALRNDHKDLVRYLLAMNADLTLVDKQGMTPFHLCCHLGLEELVPAFHNYGAKLLLKSTDDGSVQQLRPLETMAVNDSTEWFIISSEDEPEDLENFSITCLHVACEHGHLGVARRIITIEPGLIDLLDHNHRSPLLLACRSGRVELVECLMTENARVGERDVDGWNELHTASAAGHLDVVNIFIEEPHQLNAMTNEDESPLYLACLNGHQEVAERLITMGHDTNSATLEEETCLHAACKSRKLSLVDLVDSEEQRLHVSSNGPPLSVAFAESQYDIINYLLSKENAEEQYNLARQYANPLVVAAARGAVDTIADLLHESERFQITLEDCQSAFKAGLLASRVDVLELLCRRYPLAELNSEGNALHLACAEDLASVVKYLVVDKGLEPNAKVNGLTPLHVAAEKGRVGILQTLHIEGGDLATNVDGCSTLLLACESGSLEAVKYLVESDTEFENRVPPFWFACAQEQTHIAEYLLGTTNEERKESVLNYVNEEGFSALHLATANEDVDTVKLLLKHMETNVNCISNDGTTPLYTAVWKGNKDIVDKLLKSGADASLNRPGGVSVLHALAQSEHGSCSIFRLLQVNGGNLNSPTTDTWSPLHCAAYSGHAGLVRRMIEAGSEPMVLTTDGRSIMHAAVMGNHVKVLKELEGCGIDVDKQDDWKHTALHYAAERGQVEAIQWLLKHKARAGVRNGEGHAAIHIASKNGHTKVVEILLEDIKTSWFSGTKILSLNPSPLEVACENCQAEVVNTLLSTHKKGRRWSEGLDSAVLACSRSGSLECLEKVLAKEVGGRMVDENGNSPLTVALLNGHDHPFRRLLEIENINVNSKNKDGMTALHIAVQKNDTDSINRLLEMGATRWITNNLGETPVMIATKDGKTAIAKLLYDERDSIKVNTQGKNILHLASMNGHLETVNWMIDMGSLNVDQHDDSGKTALHFASMNGFATIVERLIECDAELNTQDRNFDSALHLAGRMGHRNVVQLLLKQEQTDPCIVNSEGMTVLHEAVKTSSSTIANCLLFNVRDVLLSLLNQPDSEGHTALHLAIQNSDREMMTTLLHNGAGSGIQNRQGETPLYIAALKFGDNTPRQFFENGAEPNIVPGGAMPLLHFACVRGYPVLLQFPTCGDEPLNTTFDGKTPIILAAENGHYHCLDILLKHVKDVDNQAVDSDGYSALHYACRLGNFEMVRALVAAGYDVGLLANDGESPYDLAQGQGHHEIVEYLDEVVNAELTELIVNDVRED